MAVPLAVVVAGLVSIPMSFLAFRLAGGYFAIGTWVIAEVIRLVSEQIPALGGGIGTPSRLRRAHPGLPDRLRLLARPSSRSSSSWP